MFEWSHGESSRRIERIDADRVIYVISDLHLGDGTFSDIFLAKDRQLLAFLDRVRDEGAMLLVAGDAVDFSQAWFFTKILRAHGKVLGAFSDLASRGQLIYILGNHDHDLRLYVDLLRIPVVHGVEVGDDTLVMHGYEFDPVIGADLERAEWRTRIHHLVERSLGTWLRLPLQHFYTRWNRVSFWLFHKAIFWSFWKAGILDKLRGDDRATRDAERELEYWTRCQLGDPANLFRPVMQELDRGRYQTLICGHSHLPGVVTRPDGRRYANSGSWTFRSATAVRIEDGEIQVKDVITGKIYTDQLYQPMIKGELDRLTFHDWWRANYLGWLRFKVASGPEARPWYLPDPDSEREGR